MIGRPENGEYLDYFDTYISLVTEDDIVSAARGQLEAIEAFKSLVPADQVEVLHAPYTWTLKQVVGHMIDTERVFAYRLARFAAGDTESLPGFDQDEFVAHTDYNACDFGKLVDELCQTRLSNLYLLERQSPETAKRTGVADGKNMTVRAAAYVMVGHIRYHAAIMKKRLGQG